MRRFVCFWVIGAFFFGVGTLLSVPRFSADGVVAQFSSPEPPPSPPDGPNPPPPPPEGFSA